MAPFLDGRRDLLHAGRAGVGGEHLPRRPDAVGDREKAAENDQIEHGFFPLNAGPGDCCEMRHDLRD